MESYGGHAPSKSLKIRRKVIGNLKYPVSVLGHLKYPVSVLGHLKYPVFCGAGIFEGWRDGWIITQASG